MIVGGGGFVMTTVSGTALVSVEGVGGVVGSVDGTSDVGGSVTTTVVSTGGTGEVCVTEVFGVTVVAGSVPTGGDVSESPQPAPDTATATVNTNGAANLRRRTGSLVTRLIPSPPAAANFVVTLLPRKPTLATSAPPPAPGRFEPRWRNSSDARTSRSVVVSVGPERVLVVP